MVLIGIVSSSARSLQGRQHRDHDRAHPYRGGMDAYRGGIRMRIVVVFGCNARGYAVFPRVTRSTRTSTRWSTSSAQFCAVI